MPIRKLEPPKGKDHPELRARLVDELDRAPVGPIDPNVPYIVEESVSRGSLLHIAVYWDDWKEIPHEERGAVIMDAYTQHFGPEIQERITIAMGLTHSEARKLGIGPPEILNPS